MRDFLRRSAFMQNIKTIINADQCFPKNAGMFDQFIRHQIMRFHKTLKRKRFVFSDILICRPSIFYFHNFLFIADNFLAVDDIRNLPQRKRICLYGKRGLNRLDPIVFS